MKTLSGKRSSQAGVALIVGLVLMLIATIVALASMRGTHMQERITSNQSQKMIAQLAAETGGSAFTHWLLSTNNWGGTPPLPTTPSGAPSVGGYGYYYLPQDNGNNPVYDSATGILTAIVVGVAKHPGDSSANTLAEAALRLVFKGPTASELLDIFGGGMFSDQDIQINGNCQIVGSGHANGSLACTSNSATQSIHTGGDLSAVGTVEHPNSVSMLPNASEIAIPAPEIAALLEQAEDDPNVTVVELTPTTVGGGPNRRQQCSATYSGDQLGTVYYCPGEFVISGSHSNAVFLSTGNVIYNGSGQRGEAVLNDDGITVEPVSVGVYAAGTIRFNGSSDSYGLFHSGGEYIHNGSGTVYGGIVAGGDITRNGTFRFTEWDEFDLSVRPPPPDPSAESLLVWQELY